MSFDYELPYKTDRFQAIRLGPRMILYLAINNSSGKICIARNLTWKSMWTIYLGQDALDWPDSDCKVASSIDSAMTALFSI